MYSDDGVLLGWVREKGGQRHEFTRHGFRVRTYDDLGRPRRAEAIAYPVQTDQSGWMWVESRPTGDVFVYDYEGHEDRLGWIADREAD